MENLKLDTSGGSREGSALRALLRSALRIMFIAIIAALCGFLVGVWYSLDLLPSGSDDSSTSTSTTQPSTSSFIQTFGLPSASELNLRRHASLRRAIE